MTKKNPKLYRITEIEEISGVSRRTIHFYLQTQLLHPPLKTGKTMAYYDDSHLNKLKYINDEKSKGESLSSIQNQINEIEKNGEYPFGKPVTDTSILENKPPAI